MGDSDKIVNLFGTNLNLDKWTIVSFSSFNNPENTNDSGAKYET